MGSNPNPALLTDNRYYGKFLSLEDFEEKKVFSKWQPCYYQVRGCVSTVELVLEMHAI
jgi:hypothetical protein